MVLASGAVVLFGGWSGNLANYTFPNYYIYVRDIILLACLIVIVFTSIEQKIPRPKFLIVVILYLASLIIAWRVTDDAMGVVHFAYRNFIFWIFALFLFSICPVKDIEKSFDQIFWVISLYVSASVLFFFDYNYFGRNFGFFYNPNIAGNISLLVIFYHFINIINKISIFPNLIFGCLSFLSFLLTGSITAFIMFIFLGFFMIVIGLKYGKIGFRFFAILGFVFGALIFYSSYVSLFTELLKRLDSVTGSNSSTIDGRLEQYTSTLNFSADLKISHLFLGFRANDSYATYDTFYIQTLQNHGLLGLFVIFSLLLWIGFLLLRSIKIYKIIFNDRVILIAYMILGWYIVNIGIGFLANSFATKFPFNAISALIIGVMLSLFTWKETQKYLSVNSESADKT